MTQIKIEKGVPLPVGPYGGPQKGAARKYPFPSMKVGDSFLVQDTSKSKSVQHAAYMYAAMHNLRHPKDKVKFTTRTLLNGVRVWRIQ